MYSLEQKKTSQVTDGMSDARFPRFDRNGKYLYFTASTDTGLATAGLDMSSDERRVSRSVYVAVLSKDEESPLAPESDEEGKKAKDDKEGEGDSKAEKSAGDEKGKARGEETKDDEKKQERPVVVRIDLDGIDQRILALPIPSKNFLSMLAGKSGVALPC